MDEHQALQVQINLARWEGVFEVLSIERVEPFLLEMGLHISNVEVLRTLARQFLSRLEQLPADATAASESLLKETLAAIGRTIDVQTAEDLQRWGETTFSLGNQKYSFGWIWLLSWLAGIGGKEYPPQQPELDRDKAEAIIHVTQKRFGDSLDIERRVEVAEQLPRSAWEESIYSKGEAGYSPLMSVHNTIENYRFQEAWKDIESLLTDDEIAVLVQWAKACAPQVNLNPDSIDRPRF